MRGSGIRGSNSLKVQYRYRFGNYRFSPIRGLGIIGSTIRGSRFIQKVGELVIQSVNKKSLYKYGLHLDSNISCCNSSLIRARNTHAWGPGFNFFPKVL
jgi:hypothetical protein